MTRRTRRRVYVVVLAALIGAGSPIWAPPLLQTLPTFRVEQVEVVGTRFLAPDEVAARADVPPDASVWDEPDRWRRRVETHPLVERARVRRSGFHSLEISVEEEEPVALVATSSALRPVSGDGVLLPLDPARHELDLPILLPGGSTLESGGEEEAASAKDRNEGADADAQVKERIDVERLEGVEARTLVRVLSRLRDEEPGFVAKISSLRILEGGGVEVSMVESTHAGTVLLPSEEPARALRRVELALGEQEGAVARADARFRNQVVLERAGGDS